MRVYLLTYTHCGGTCIPTTNEPLNEKVEKVLRGLALCSFDVCAHIPA